MHTTSDLEPSKATPTTLLKNQIHQRTLINSITRKIKLNRTFRRIDRDKSLFEIQFTIKRREDGHLLCAPT